MDIYREKWYEAILTRRSRRQYLLKALDLELNVYLHDFANKLSSSMPGVRVVFVTENPETVFKGLVGSYGKIKNAPAYAAFIGDLRDANVQEKTGYLGESFILEATALGLGTCWIGGFFNPEVALAQTGAQKHEQVLAVTPVGYVDKNYTLEEKIMSGFSNMHKRKVLSKLHSGLDPNRWPEWVKSGLEAARLAPSAVNRQPWRFTVEEDGITVTTDASTLNYNISKRLDCGIAMLHLEVGALHMGAKGKWDYLSDPEVAKFSLTEARKLG